MSSSVINACTNIEQLAVFGSKNGARVSIEFMSFPLFAIVKNGKDVKPVPWIVMEDNSFELADDMPGYLGIEGKFVDEEAQAEAAARWRKHVREEGIRLPKSDDDEDLDDDFEDEDEEDENEDENEDEDLDDDSEEDKDVEEPEGRTEH
jgi:hypothetical protein